MMYQFPQRLKDLREQHGYTQDALASELYVSRQAISQWENGKSSPDIDKLIALANLYSISVDELLCMRTKTENNIQSQEEIVPTSSEDTDNSILFEQMRIAVLLILSSIIPFLPFIVSIFTAIWMKKTNRTYYLIYTLCLFIFLFGCYNTSNFISFHMLDYGMTVSQFI